MRNAIARVLGVMFRPALFGLLVLLLPAVGRHRGPRYVVRAPECRPVLRPRIPVRRPACRRAAAPRPASSRVRPYWTAFETRAVQRWRRQALWLATVGVDIDTRNIHAGGGVR